MKRSKSFRARLLLRMLSLLKPRFADLSVEQTRAMTKNSGFQLPKEVTVTQIEDISAQWITPDNLSPSSVLLYLHGGCYVQNTPKTHHAFVARIAKTTGIRALYVDYRLAPEHPFPAALNDTINAYQWLLKQGISPHNICFAGDSAGGGLALAAMLQLHADNLPLPAAAVLLSPWCDLTMSSPSASQDRDPIYSSRMFLKFAQLYAGELPLDHPLISPLYADLKTMPPILIQAGELELLRDDAVHVAERLREAGTEVKLSLYEGLWHVWQVYPAVMLPESAIAIQEIGDFLRSHISTY